MKAGAADFRLITFAAEAARQVAVDLTSARTKLTAFVEVLHIGSPCLSLKK
jgi:hypothetical protein